MDKARTLPPLVRGKVTGVLNFFVDEIRIFKNSLLTDKIDLVLQVQWWGESSPALLRPKKLQVEDRSYKNSHSLEFYYYLVKYEIKTTLDLFKIYLKSSERVEFCVLETSQKYVIGSAFLRELNNLLNNNNKPIKMSVYNYLGVVIGEVIIHINFIENLQYKHKPSQNEITLSDKNSYLDKKSEKIEKEEFAEKIKSNAFTLSEKILFYDVHSNINSPKKDCFMHLEPPADENYLKKNKPHFKNSDVTQSVRNQNNDLLTRQEINMNHKSELDSKEFSYECLPNIKTLSDTSKVLHFGVTSSQQLNSKISVETNGAKAVSKFNSNSIKCKSKSKNMKNNFSFDQDLCNKKPNLKITESSKNLSKNATKLKKKDQCDFKNSLLCNSLMPETLLSCKQTDLQSITSRESLNYKVLDYLLGSDMSKEDEEIALNNFKEMSPSHNLVNSISQLCLNSDKNVGMPENGSYFKSPLISLKPSYLNFDFNNPIERNYYKKFFLKSKSNSDFEVAEFLNLPENRVMYDKLKFNETLCQRNEPQKNSDKNTGEYLYAEKEINETKIKENHLVNKICESNKISSCAHCKYYKKLDELDTIIESLKHFEQKMLKYNKDLQLDFKQNSDVSIKKNIN